MILVGIIVLVVGLSILSLFRRGSTPTRIPTRGCGHATGAAEPDNVNQWASLNRSNPRKTKGMELGLQNQEVMLGDSATFRLRLCDDTEEAGEWNKDDVTLTHCGKTQISVSGRDRCLTVTNVHPADTGTYGCRVGEEITSAKLSINEAYCIQVPPPPIVRI